MATTDEKMRFSRVGSGFDLPEVEHGVLDLWERERSFDALRKKNAGGPHFSFVDGPITANIEAMGVHHAWGRTYKDAYNRYFAMTGRELRHPLRVEPDEARRDSRIRQHTPGESQGELGPHRLEEPRPNHDAQQCEPGFRGQHVRGSVRDGQYLGKPLGPVSALSA